MKLTVGVDVDGVVADLHKEWLRRYNTDFNDNLTEEDIKTWAIQEYVKPEARVLNKNGLMPIFQYLQDPDLYEQTPEIPHAREGLEYIRRRGHDVVLVSSCVLNQADQKMHWVINHKMITPLRGDTLLDFVAMSDKRFLKADALIDDRDKNVKEAMGFRILYDSPWNYDTSPEDYDYRMNSWLDVEDVVDRLEHFWGSTTVAFSADVG